MFQDNLLYYPEAANVAEMVSGGLAAWPSAVDFRGLLAEADGPPRGTAVIFHGNAGHAGHRDFYVGVLTRLGPVSYTHLDVYKRQARKCRDAMASLPRRRQP